ncbi:MAG: alpha/beta hydrolase [Caldilineaceae bacterium]|nr:alpha/beta hydrolase [Caldilineaceae bacterium]
MTSTALRVPTERLEFFCRVHGDREAGLPMLLLHGSFATSRWWEPFFAILPDEVYAVAPDLRGCGQSGRSESGYEIDEQADDILALVEALGWRDFDLVGHSSGGAIALEIALARPNLLNTLTLVDSVPAEGVHTPLEVVMILEQMKSDRDLLARAIAR